MFTRTTLSGLQALIFLSLRGENSPIAPGRIAERLGLSASYLSKVARRLVRADILRARRGSKGGVTLNRPADRITLLEIVEACQGVPGPLAIEPRGGTPVCAFHRAWRELHSLHTTTLASWTLETLAAHPCDSMTCDDVLRCGVSSSTNP